MNIREDLKNLLYDVEQICDGPFVEFLSDNWDIIENPEEIVKLILSNRDRINTELEVTYEYENDELTQINSCGKAFNWEYEVVVKPFSYKCYYTCRKHDPPLREIETSLTDAWLNSYKEGCLKKIIDMSNDIKVEMKLTGKWDSPLFYQE